MNLGDLVLQNFFGIVASVIASVLGFLAVRILRGVRASSERTEAHAAETAEKVSQLDKVSLTAHNAELEEWQRDMALRIEAVAEMKSDTLAGQANNDRRVTEVHAALDATRADLAEVRAELAACKRFMWELDAYAHGTGPVPIFSPDETYSTGTHALEGALHDQH